MNIIEINESNYQDFAKLDIVAFSFAYEGAMGEMGGIYIIDKAGQMYHANYFWGDNLIDRDHIKDIIPVFDDLDFGLLGCESKNEDWVPVYLGYGNSLLIIKDLSDGFNKKVEEADFQSSGELFQQWPGIVLGLLGAGNSTLTMSDIWEIKNTRQHRHDNTQTDDMKERVIRLGCTWQYDQDPSEIEIQCATESVEFDEVAYVPITDRVKMQVCVLRKGDKYGVYTNAVNKGFGGPGVWCSPTLNPFPYDEVKYCSFPWDYPNEYGVFAYRIGTKWGIIEVVDGSNEEEGIYDVEYLFTKRRIVVPCEYVALEDAELQLGKTYDWKDPFKVEAPLETELVEPAKRDVKKGTGRDKIRVTFPDGMVIEDSVVWKTLAETIKRIGVKRVEQLKIPGNIKRNILLVDTRPTDDVIYKESQKEIEPGYYLLTYNNTEQKARYLEQISDELHLDLKIEVISYQS